MDKTQFAIRMNNAATNDPCAVCGRRTDPQIGPELFLENSWALVCRPCGIEHVPELVALLDRKMAQIFLKNGDLRAAVIEHGRG